MINYKKRNYWLLVSEAKIINDLNKEIKEFEKSKAKIIDLKINNRLKVRWTMESEQDQKFIKAGKSPTFKTYICPVTGVKHNFGE